jgi:hypothetical protein
MKYLFLLAVAFSLIANERDHKAPYITGDGFRSIADHLFDETSRDISIEKIKSYDSIFVKSDFLSQFINEILPQISTPFIVISHNSDHGPEPKHNRLADNKHLVAWFAQNCSKYSHDKLIPIPIGIENNYVLNATKFACIKELSGQTLEKNMVFYINCSQSTNIKERKPLYSKIMRRKFVVDTTLPMRDYMKKLASAKFVASPPGNGFDCHRTWEALYVNTYPVVKKSLSDRLFSDLPVLLVKNYVSLTPAHLNNAYNKYSKRDFRWEKITMEYWWKQIRSAQQR